MKPARSPARYSAALATSSSVPIRAIGRNERTNCIAYFLQLMSIQTSFIARARVRSAQRLLETTRLDVEQVAAHCGFGPPQCCASISPLSSGRAQ